jgi:hypothetical protein
MGQKAGPDRGLFGVMPVAAQGLVEPLAHLMRLEALHLRPVRRFTVGLHDGPRLLPAHRVALALAEVITGCSRMFGLTRTLKHVGVAQLGVALDGLVPFENFPAWVPSTCTG